MMNTSIGLLQILIGFFLALLFPLTLFSQEIADTTQQDSDITVKLVEIDYQLGLPVNEFKEKLNKNLHGASFAYYVQRKANKPQFFGARIKYTFIDSQQSVIFDSINGVLAEVEKSVNSQIISLKGAYRIYLDASFWKFDPYVEVDLGAAGYYMTERETIVLNDAGSDVQVKDFDLGLVYGISAGTQVHISQNTFLNLRTTFNGGTINSYNVKQGELEEDPSDNFRLETSSTTAVNILIGFSFLF